MNQPKKSRGLAVPMTISVYPHERDAMMRMMRDEGLKSVFDVVRRMAQDLNCRELEPPKKRNC